MAPRSARAKRLHIPGAPRSAMQRRFTPSMAAVPPTNAASASTHAHTPPLVVPPMKAAPDVTTEACTVPPPAATTAEIPAVFKVEAVLPASLAVAPAAPPSHTRAEAPTATAVVAPAQIGLTSPQQLTSTAANAAVSPAASVGIPATSGSVPPRTTSARRHRRRRITHRNSTASSRPSIPLPPPTAATATVNFALSAAVVEMKAHEPAKVVDVAPIAITMETEVPPSSSVSTVSETEEKEVIKVLAAVVAPAPAQTLSAPPAPTVEEATNDATLAASVPPPPYARATINRLPAKKKFFTELESDNAAVAVESVAMIAAVKEKGRAAEAIQVHTASPAAVNKEASVFTLKSQTVEAEDLLTSTVVATPAPAAPSRRAAISRLPKKRAVTKNPVQVEVTPAPEALAAVESKPAVLPPEAAISPPAATIEAPPSVMAMPPRATISRIPQPRKKRTVTTTAAAAATTEVREKVPVPSSTAVPVSVPTPPTSITTAQPAVAEASPPQPAAALTHRAITSRGARGMRRDTTAAEAAPSEVPSALSGVDAAIEPPRMVKVAAPTAETVASAISNATVPPSTAEVVEPAAETPKRKTLSKAAKRASKLRRMRFKRPLTPYAAWRREQQSLKRIPKRFRPPPRPWVPPPPVEEVKKAVPMQETATADVAVEIPTTAPPITVAAPVAVLESNPIKVATVVATGDGSPSAVAAALPTAATAPAASVPKKDKKKMKVKKTQAVKAKAPVVPAKKGRRSRSTGKSARQSMIRLPHPSRLGVFTETKEAEAVQAPSMAVVMERAEPTEAPAAVSADAAEKVPVKEAVMEEVVAATELPSSEAVNEAVPATPAAEDAVTASESVNVQEHVEEPVSAALNEATTMTTASTEEGVATTTAEVEAPAVDTVEAPSAPLDDAAPFVANNISGSPASERATIATAVGVEDTAPMETVDAAEAPAVPVSASPTTTTTAVAAEASAPEPVEAKKASQRMSRQAMLRRIRASKKGGKKPLKQQQQQTEMTKEAPKAVDDAPAQEAAAASAPFPSPAEESVTAADAVEERQSTEATVEAAVADHLSLNLLTEAAEAHPSMEVSDNINTTAAIAEPAEEEATALATPAISAAAVEDEWSQLAADDASAAASTPSVKTSEHTPLAVQSSWSALATEQAPAMEQPGVASTSAETFPTATARRLAAKSKIKQHAKLAAARRKPQKKAPAVSPAAETTTVVDTPLVQSTHAAAAPPLPSPAEASAEALVRNAALSLPGGRAVVEAYTETEMLLRRRTLDDSWGVGLRFDWQQRTLAISAFPEFNATDARATHPFVTLYKSQPRWYLAEVNGASAAYMKEALEAMKRSLTARFVFRKLK